MNKYYAIVNNTLMSKREAEACVNWHHAHNTYPDWNCYIVKVGALKGKTRYVVHRHRTKPYPGDLDYREESN